MNLMDAEREVGRLLERWFDRMQVAGEAWRKDAQYRAEFTRMRRTFVAMDMAMEDEGISEPTRLRVIRTLIYGAPDEAEALARMERQAAEVERLKTMPFAGITVPEDLLRGSAGGP